MRNKESTEVTISNIAVPKAENYLYFSFTIQSKGNIDEVIIQHKVEMAKWRNACRVLCDKFHWD